jgi:hypothetical protein
MTPDAQGALFSGRARVDYARDIKLSPTTATTAQDNAFMMTLAFIETRSSPGD